MNWRRPGWWGAARWVPSLRQKAAAESTDIAAVVRPADQQEPAASTRPASARHPSSPGQYWLDSPTTISPGSPCAPPNKPPYNKRNKIDEERFEGGPGTAN